MNWSCCIQFFILATRPLSHKIALPTQTPLRRVSLQPKTLAIRVWYPILGAGGAGADCFSSEEARRLHIFWGWMADLAGGGQVLEDAAGGGRGGGRNRGFVCGRYQQHISELLNLLRHLLALSFHLLQY